MVDDASLVGQFLDLHHTIGGVVEITSMCVVPWKCFTIKIVQLWSNL